VQVVEVGSKVQIACTEVSAARRKLFCALRRACGGSIANQRSGSPSVLGRCCTFGSGLPSLAMRAWNTEELISPCLDDAPIEMVELICGEV
jgi:hypothetical protein